MKECEKQDHMSLLSWNVKRKQFHQGMKVIVTSSIPDENLEKGDEIIIRIISH